MFEAMGLLFKFFVLILEEIFRAKKEAREAQKKFELSEALMREWLERAVEKFKRDTLDDNQAVPTLQDRLDEALEQKGEINANAGNAEPQCGRVNCGSRSS